MEHGCVCFCQRIPGSCCEHARSARVRHLDGAFQCSCYLERSLAEVPSFDLHVSIHIYIITVKGVDPFFSTVRDAGPGMDIYISSCLDTEDIFGQDASIDMDRCVTAVCIHSKPTSSYRSSVDHERSRLYSYAVAVMPFDHAVIQGTGGMPVNVHPGRSKVGPRAWCPRRDRDPVHRDVCSFRYTDHCSPVIGVKRSFAVCTEDHVARTDFDGPIHNDCSININHNWICFRSTDDRHWPDSFGIIPTLIITFPTQFRNHISSLQEFSAYGAIRITRIPCGCLCRFNCITDFFRMPGCWDHPTTVFNFVRSFPITVISIANGAFPVCSIACLCTGWINGRMLNERMRHESIITIYASFVFRSFSRCYDDIQRLSNILVCYLIRLIRCPFNWAFSSIPLIFQVFLYVQLREIRCDQLPTIYICWNLNGSFYGWKRPPENWIRITVIRTDRPDGIEVKADVIICVLHLIII